jgi:copper transport protein
MRRLSALFLALCAAVTLTSGVAHAAGDNTLESSSPASGESITLAPTQIQLKFAKPIGGADAISKMGLVLTCESKITNLGPPQLAADGVTVSAALTQVLSNGSCTVTWSLPDGSIGSFSFTSVVNPTTTVPSSTPGSDTTLPGDSTGATATQPPRLGGPIGLVRWLTFLFVSAMFGGLMFVRFIWPEGVEYSITERYFRQVGIAAVALSYLLATLMAARQGDGSIAGALSPTSWGPLFETYEGRAAFVRFLAVAGLAYFAWITERIFEPISSTVVSVLLTMSVASYGFDRVTGRAVILGVLLAIAHMAAVAMWVGTIALIWRVILHGPGDRDLVEALNGWARIATTLTIVIVGTGAAQVWRIDGISLLNSGHGRVILLKSIVVGGLVFVSSAVRQFILRGISNAKSLNERAVYRLKRPVGVELSVSIFVLALSSWLMAMRPPYVLLRDEKPKVQYAIVQDMTGEDDFHVRLSISPGNVGVNTVLVELFGPARIQNFVITFTPDNPNYSGYTLNVPITRPGGAVITESTGFKLLAPGQWTATVKGVTTTGDLPVLSTKFIIADGVTVTTQPKQGLEPVATTTSTLALGATTTTTIAQSGTPTTTTLPAPQG